MALVEVVAAPTTDPAVADRAAARMTAWGKTPVRAADTPGFIVNRVNRPFTIQALRMLEDRVAGIESIDDAMRAAGFPMGPFELMDLTGIDVTLAAARSIWDRLGRPDRLRPSPIQERLVAERHLGRSTGIGFYRYPGGARGAIESSVAIDPTRALDADGIVSWILAAIDEEAVRAVVEGVYRGELGKWWQNSDIAKKLQLSDGQIAQLDQTFYDHKLKLIDYGADMEKQDLKLQALLDADVPNEGQVEAQVDQVLAARGKLEREFTLMNLDLRKVLSLDQWRQLKAVRGATGTMGDRVFFRKVLPPGATPSTVPLPPDVPLPPLPPPPGTR